MTNGKEFYSISSECILWNTWLTTTETKHFCIPSNDFTNVVLTFCMVVCKSK